MGNQNSNEFIERAKEAVEISFNSQHAYAIGLGEDQEIKQEDLYVVWFAKTLQNWKALVSTDALKGVYWEVTYNGDKGEAYVDEYQKSYNSTYVFTS